ncbi:non-homologous end-joining DNA ligase [Leucobacter allii]|uniref:DNA ligase (ATP) n=1 Tax=Leucobacter allii TaxID=2932247 RepID=A0ABY4FGY3_9MICO|nr:non-homologous end-joining DNA ligase [Leucobacter allii]UOQ55896.1 non-homologous end-joining DNA ligase [Leucobacter allii]
MAGTRRSDGGRQRTSRRRGASPPAGSRADAAQTVEIGGRRIRITHPDKVLYPSTGTTKGEIIGYYSAIAETMLPHCRDRPATRKRWPDGVGADGRGDVFFQKDLGDTAPEWVRTGRIQHKDHVNAYPLVNDEATLVWLAQLAALEIHVPQWRFDATGEPQPPDRLVFDLDPGEGVSLQQCARIAFLVREVLRGMGLDPVPVTSGSSGIHLYAALDGSQSSDAASAVARELARSLEADHPDEITSSMKRSLRPGRVFIDWSQNNAAKTTVAPYSLRGRIAPTVAAPRSWRELASPHLRQLEFREVLARVARRGDPLAELVARGSDAAPDRLDDYRAKRDARRTPEPVPARGRSRSGSRGGGAARGADDDTEGDRGDAPVFVIQRHEARRLHFDFRLEHDGVLVSWALPKGVPTDPGVNHLAVPTEDHPMAYRHFEGVIPAGEYGAGEVRIWDSGRYALEKWREDEVVVALEGGPGGGLGGTRRYALFRTGREDGAPWMIHLMSEETPHRRLRRGRASAAGEPAAAGPDVPPPMLAVAGAAGALPRLDPAAWAFEMKWDGIRAIARIDVEHCALRSRSGGDLTAAYPELAALPRIVNAEDAVLDGEIVSLGGDGAPSFSRLQQRFGLTAPRDVARARRAAPASYLIFDVLRINGRDCRGLPYRQRRELLTALIDADPGVPAALPEVFAGSGAEAAEASRSLGLEGVVAKRWESPYRSGARTADWRKFPSIATAEFAVIGWRESPSDARGIASLLLAEPAELAMPAHAPDRAGGPDRTADGAAGASPAWHYAGRVGTGFSAAERRAIRARLAPLECARPVAAVPPEARRDAHWVRPELVAEVVAKGRTAGGSLRQPVWRGWRPDKRPGDLDA